MEYPIGTHTGFRENSAIHTWVMDLSVALNYGLP